MSDKLIETAPRGVTVAVVLTILVAGVLRVWTISAGAPFRMGIDEPVVLSLALKMMKSGDFNPHFFDYGGVTLYLHLAVAVLRFIFGALHRQWVSLDDVWEGDFLVASRFATAVLGTITVYIVYRAALRWGRGAALAAAIAMAVLGQHVRESHYALTDIPVTLAIALTTLLSLRAEESKRLRAYLAAGLAAGLAASTKYNGAIALVMPLAAACAMPGIRRVGAAAGVAAAGVGVGFLVGSPYAVLDLPEFLNGFAHLAASYNQPRPFAATAINYLKYLRGWFSWPGMLSIEIGWIALVIAAAGFLIAIGQMRSPLTRARAAILVVFPLLYFYLISSEGSLQYGRYTLPLAPMVCTAIGIGTVAVYRRLRAIGPLAGGVWLGVSLLLVVPPLASDIRGNLNQRLVGTSELAGAWLMANVRPGEPVVIESIAVTLPPRLTVRNVNVLIGNTMDDYKREGVVYLVASSLLSDRYRLAPISNGAELRAYLDLVRAGQTMAVFNHSDQHPGATITIVRVPK